MNTTRQTEPRSPSVLQTLDEWLFTNPAAQSRQTRLKVEWVLLPTLLLLGIAHWLLMLHSDAPLRVLDWVWEHRFMTVVREALRTGVIPFHTSDDYNGSHRFLAFVNISTFPQVLLLKYWSTDVYFRINTIVFYLIGFHGLLLLRKRFNLSFLAFFVLYLLFNYNGYIISHLVVGHSQWYACYLIPYFIHGIYGMLERPKTYAPPFCLTAAFILMLAQGSIHIFFICMMFLGLAMVFHFSLSRAVQFLGMNVIIFLVAAYKLIPALTSFSDVKRMYFPSYPHLGRLLDALVMIRRVDYRYAYEGGYYAWEYNVYISIFGLLFLALFGLVFRLVKFRGRRHGPAISLDLPLIVMFVIAATDLYRHVILMNIPFLSNVERVPSRFMIVPLMVLTTISCARMQSLLDAGIFKRYHKAILLAGSLGLAMMLLMHSGTWQVNKMLQLTHERFTSPEAYILQVNDPKYERIVIMSWLLSAVSAAAWLSWLWYRRIRNPMKATELTIEAPAEPSSERDDQQVVSRV